MLQNQNVDQNNESEIWNILMDDSDLGYELRNLMEIGERIWQRGWAESNAGNVSLRIPKHLMDRVIPLIQANRKGSSGPETSPEHESCNWMLMSATGSRFREFKKLSFESFVLVASREINGSKQLNDWLVTFPTTRRPTSESATHLMVQRWLQRNRPQDRVILHAHPTDWIVISSLPEYMDNKLDLVESIINQLPETEYYLPLGFVLLPFADPGSDKLAKMTEASLSETNIVVWGKHGVLITADSINKAFDYLEVTAKAANVYLKLR